MEEGGEAFSGHQLGGQWVKMQAKKWASNRSISEESKKKIFHKGAESKHTKRQKSKTLDGINVGKGKMWT